MDLLINWDSDKKVGAQENSTKVSFMFIQGQLFPSLAYGTIRDLPEESAWCNDSPQLHCKQIQQWLASQSQSINLLQTWIQTPCTTYPHWNKENGKDIYYWQTNSCLCVVDQILCKFRFDVLSQNIIMLNWQLDWIIKLKVYIIVVAARFCCISRKIEKLRLQLCCGWACQHYIG